MGRRGSYATVVGKSSRGGLGSCVNTPKEAGLLAAGQPAEQALGLQPLPLGPGATNNSSRGLLQCQGPEDSDTGPGPAQPCKSGSFSMGPEKVIIVHPKDKTFGCPKKQTEANLYVPVIG